MCIDCVIRQSDDKIKWMYACSCFARKYDTKKLIKGKIKKTRKFVFGAELSMLEVVKYDHFWHQCCKMWYFIACKVCPVSETIITESARTSVYNQGSNTTIGFRAPD